VSITDDAPAYLIDVTETSPTFGKRTPAAVKFVAAGYDFIAPNWLVIQPFPGFPLREKTTYAAVLTDKLRAADGGPVRRAPYMTSILGEPGVGAVQTAQKAYAPFLTWLAGQGDVKNHVVNATVFTTVEATAIMTKLRQTIIDSVPKPVLMDFVWVNEDAGGNDDVFEGKYDSPNFQVGAPPYTTTGGQIELDSSGTPKVQRTESLRVAMTIPKGTMPPNGWPVVLYAHGTGGNYMTFVGDRSGADVAKVTDSTGAVIAQMAMISIDQVLHGPRDPTGGSPDTNFFNFNNLTAAHDNPKQGALDDFQLLRLVKEIDIASAPTTSSPIRFDPDKIYFKGHSQGALTGALFLAADREVHSAVLSGAGGGLMFSLVHKTQPFDIAKLLGAILRDPIDEVHPLLNLAQAFFEDADPINYAPLLFKNTTSPKSIFQPIGLIDHYTPVPNNKAFMLAAGLQPAGTELDPIAGLPLTGLSFTSALPIVNNVAGGQATGVAIEYNATGKNDGHFVVFDVADARRTASRFLGTHAATGASRIDPP